MKPTRYTNSIFVGEDSQGRPMLEYIALDEINITVQPGRRLKTPSKSKVRWTSLDGDIEIRFDDDPLFDSCRGLVLTASRGETTDYLKLPSAPQGSTLTLKYTAKVYSDKQTVEEDPQIIIDDSSFRNFG